MARQEDNSVGEAGEYPLIVDLGGVGGVQGAVDHEAHYEDEAGNGDYDVADEDEAVLEAHEVVVGDVPGEDGAGFGEAE